MTTAARLIKAILTNPAGVDIGILANDLLREFHRGFPVDALRPLLSSPDENVVRAAAFVASELGSNAKPLLGLMVTLLDYPNRFVQSDAICSVLTCASASDQGAIAAVIALLNDPDWPIRWKTMEFLALASSEQLRAGLSRFEDMDSKLGHVRGLRWLAGETGHEVDEIVRWLKSPNSCDRKYGAVAAARIRRITSAPLKLAYLSDDTDIKQFAESMLKIGENIDDQSK